MTHVYQWQWRGSLRDTGGGGSRVLYIVVATMVLLVLCVASMDTPSTAALQHTQPIIDNPPVICRDVSIRNSVLKLMYLENCTIIDGYLQILLMEYPKPGEFDGLSFPKLVEITGYLLLYRVMALTTLRHLFPNLTIIRGETLFLNWALAIFEVQDMEEIGLIGLTEISRGAIRFEKNKDMCFINTVDWKLIVNTSYYENNFIKQNKNPNQCVEFCPNGCPVRNGMNLCWSDRGCQKVCPPSCGNKACGVRRSLSNICCHPECAGGCTGASDRDCVACRHVYDGGRCKPKCRPGLLEFKNHRCITAEMCKKGESRLPKYKVFNNTHCLKDCPSKFKEDPNDRHRCIPCKGPCPKFCYGSKIKGVSHAQKLKGCTVIKGSLEFQIMKGTNIQEDLQKSLGKIEVVHNYIQVSRSYAFISLNFLTSLREIRGEKLQSNKYAVSIMHNANLQAMWSDEKHPKVKITNSNARVFFHNNPKLCLSKIEKFLDDVGFRRNINYTDQEVSSKTNGDRAACNLGTIVFNITIVRFHAAVFTWRPYYDIDRRSISYVISYRVAPFRNLTIFDGRDACRNNVWTDVDINDELEDPFYEIIYGLKPFTQYAVYVYVNPIETVPNNVGARSDLMYFTTKPTKPSQPQNLQIRNEKKDELTVVWDPPAKPNGIVTEYIVYWVAKPFKESKFRNRNFCLTKLRLPSIEKNKPQPTMTEEEMIKNATTNQCKCEKSKEEKEEEEIERAMQIKFENFLHNNVYQKRPDVANKNSSRVKREKEGLLNVPRVSNDTTPLPDVPDEAEPLLEIENPSTIHGENVHVNYTTDGLKGNHTVNTSLTTSTAPTTTAEQEHYDEEEISVMIVYKNLIVIPNLKHFMEYTVEVIACHKDQSMCGLRTITGGRTLKKQNADNILDSSINKTVNQHNVTISWEPPYNPNSLILSYELKFSRLDDTEIKLHEKCIPFEKFNNSNNSYTISSLNPGNYTFQVRAFTLAGNGSWTSPQHFFIIEKRVDRTVGGVMGRVPVSIVVGVIAAAVSLVILFVLGSLWYIRKRRLQNTPPDGIIYASVNPEYLSAGDVYVPDEWEVDRDKISLIRELGQGSFGMVYEGIARGLINQEKVEVKVAVKTVNENASIRDRIEFLNEASVMKAFNCHHVVRLLGVVSKGQPTLVVMELMSRGDLKNFLRLHRPDEPDNHGRKPPSLVQILQMATEIADGMTYLSVKKYVHRDLAARNCMVHEDMTVKIGDFGMTRDIYETDYYRKGGKGLLPVRWMGPESLKDGVFTSKSDIWSYGVVLWEMATLAAQPYQGLSNEQVLKYVIEGHLMERPDGCPDKLWDLMGLCWQYYPKQRPSFYHILDVLCEDVDPRFVKMSFYHSSENTRVYEPDNNDDADNASVKDHLNPDQEDMSDYRDMVMYDSGNHDHDLNQGPRIHDTSSDLEVHADTDNASDQSKSVSCECIKQTLTNEMKKRRRSSANTNNIVPIYPVSNSNEGSKGSSKSSESDGYSRMNGYVNGHANIHLIRSTEC